MWVVLIDQTELKIILGFGAIAPIQKASLWRCDRAAYHSTNHWDDEVFYQIQRVFLKFTIENGFSLDNMLYQTVGSDRAPRIDQTFQSV
jgi:hypothetical protein